jgi:hypothetical protein
MAYPVIGILITVHIVEAVAACAVHIERVRGKAADDVGDTPRVNLFSLFK